MNPFYVVAIAAKDKQLPEEVDAAYYASEAFYERILFRGPQGMADQVQVLLHQLKYIALDPRESEKLREWLANGLACFQFFGVASLVPMLTVKVGSEEHRQLQQAFEANLSGPLSRAVLRVRRRRAANWRRYVQHEAVIDRFRNSLPWPTSEEYRKDSEGARARSADLAALVDVKRQQLYERHRIRMAKLSKATAPRYSNWTDIVKDVAFSVLKPT